MPYVTEPLPLGALDAGIVLHVRAHWRSAIDTAQSECTPDQLREGLAFLFGVEASILSSIDLSKANTQRERIALAAGVIARQTGKAAVPLGHDAAFVRRCTSWLGRRVRSEPAFKEVFADDPATLLVLSEAIDLAATRSPAKPTPVSVLLCGETGTGKELLARAIHQMSLERRAIRRDCFIPVHVAGLGPDFVNDELFGHVKGAFTDARDNRDGKIQAADGGTLLIDEVGDLSYDAQLRLLRVVQDGQVTRTGENKTLSRFASSRQRTEILARRWSRARFAATFSTVSLRVRSNCRPSERARDGLCKSLTRSCASTGKPRHR